MARDGSGTMSVPYPDFISGKTISSTQVDANNADLVSEITNSLPRDGQAAPTANIPFGNFKITGLGAGSAATDSAHLGQVQAQAYIWCGTAGGTADAITLSPSPVITAYAAGQCFRFVASADNTGAMTVAVSGLATKDIKKTASGAAAAVAAADIKAGSIVNIVYDGTQFRVFDVIDSLESSDITGQTEVVIAADDYILLSDASDSGALKKDTVQGILDLVFPSGIIVPYGGATAPTGWLLCYGQAVSRTTYANLFTAIGTTYGVGDNSTTFNLPDLRGRVVAGQDDMGGTSANRLTGVTGSVNGDTLGGTGGTETHTLAQTELPASLSLTTLSGALDNTATGNIAGSNYTSNQRTLSITLTNSGGDQPHNNVQPTLILNYIIKE